MILFLHLWPTAKEEISSLFQIRYAKPVFPMQSISPWSPVSAKHNCMLSWALISKIEIISKIASAWGSLPCCTCCSRALSQSASEQQQLGCELLQPFIWDCREQHFHEAPDTLVHSGIQFCGSACVDVCSQEKLPAGSRGHRPRLRLWKALSCWAIVLSCTYNPTCKQGMQMLPGCTRPSESCCNSPVPSHHLQSPSHSHLFLWIWEENWKRQKICYTGDASLTTAMRTLLPQEPNIYIKC